MQKSNRRFEKIITVLIALTIFAIGIRIGLSQSGNFLKSVVEPGSMTTEASYIIFTDGTNVYARNGTTGEIEFNGTDASQVIQNTINSLTSRGKIFIKRGTYTGNNNVTVSTDGIVIEGEGPYTILNGFGIQLKASSCEVDDLQVSNAAFGVKIRPDSGVALYDRVYNCWFTTCAHGVDTQNSSEWKLESNNFYNCTIGVDVKDYGADSWILNNHFGYDTAIQTAQIYVEAAPTHLTEGLKIGANVIQSATGYGIVLENTNFVKIYDNMIATYKEAILTSDSYTSQLQILNNIIDGSITNGYNCMNIGAVEWLWIENNAIYGCYANGIAFRSSGTFPSGVYATKVWIENNKFSGNNRANLNYNDILLNSTQYAEIVGNDFNSANISGGYALREVNGIQSPTGSVELNMFRSGTVLALSSMQHTSNTGYGLPQESVETASYVISTDGTTYYATNGTTGQVDFQSTNASQVINNALSNSPVWGSIYLKGHITIDSPIVFTGSEYYNFQFEYLSVSANVSAFIFRNVKGPFKVSGQVLDATLDHHSQPLLLFDTRCEYADIDIGWLIGDYDYGKTIGINFTAGTGGYFMANRIKIQNVYSVQTVLFMNLSDDAWASINNFDLGYFEGSSPRQIYLIKTGTDAIHNNVITGSGGNINSWNPQGLSPTWTIRLETDSTGRILSTTFQNFYVYSAQDEVYRTIGNVVATRFIGGMPRMDLTSYWHDGGNATDFISCYVPDAYSYTHINTENNGNATVSNNDWIAHGLAATPTTITLTPRSNATVWVNNRNATHFQVGVSSGTVTIDWYAKV